MSIRHPILLALATLILPFPAGAAEGCLDQAADILAALDSGRWEDARRPFDARMRDGLPADKLQQVWESLPMQTGARLQVGVGREQAGKGGGASAVIPLQHEKAWLELQIGCSGEGEVTGLWVRPGQAPVAPEPAPAADAPFRERALDVASAGLTLPGTLALPRDEVRAGIVLVHGSGAHDRDETIGPNKPFRDLARGLAAKGLAVLRYEKRSHAHPESFSGKAFTVREEVVEDAVAAIALLRAQPELEGRPVYVAGHSLGALLAPRIASEAHANGMILLAPPARDLADVIPQQVRYIAQLDGKIDPTEQAALDEMLAQVALVQKLYAGPQDEATLADATPILGAPAAYWLDLRRYQPFALAQASQAPLLLLQGGRDYQVTVSQDLQTWRQRLRGKTGYEERVFAELGHLFMPAGDPPGPKDYERAATVSAEVIEAIADWTRRIADPGPAG